MKDVMEKVRKICDAEDAKYKAINELDNAKIKTSLEGVKLLGIFGIPMKFEPASAEQNLEIQKVLLSVGFKWFSMKNGETRHPRTYLYAKNGILQDSSSFNAFGDKPFTKGFNEYKAVLVEVMMC